MFPRASVKHVLGQIRQASGGTRHGNFWDTPAFQDAFAVQHMGRVARAYRRHPSHGARYGRDGIPQELLGDWLGLTQAQVSRIENGPPTRNLDTLAHWARVLRIPQELLWFKLPPSQTADAVAQVPDTQPSALAPAGPFHLVPVSDGSLHDPDTAAMRAFRSADLQVGGGHLYASVIKYLQADVGTPAVRQRRGGGVTVPSSLLPQP